MLRSDHTQTKQVQAVTTLQAILDLHLLPLVMRLESTLVGLYRWVSKQRGVAETVRRPPRSLPPVDPFPLTLPTASDVLALARPEPSASSSATRMEVGMELDAVAHNVILSLVGRAVSAADEREVPFSSLDGIRYEAVENLASSGALTLRSNDFGEVMISRNNSMIMDVGAQLLGDALQVLHINSFSYSCKLGVVLKLLRDGWRHRESPKPFKPDEAKMLLNEHRRPCSYLVCLLEHAALFAKGVPRIAHTLKDM